MGMCIYNLIAGEFSTLKRKKNPFCASYNMTIVLEIYKALDQLCFHCLLKIRPQRQSNNHSSVYTTLCPCFQLIHQSGLTWPKILLLRYNLSGFPPEDQNTTSSHWQNFTMSSYCQCCKAPARHWNTIWDLSEFKWWYLDLHMHMNLVT